MTTSTPAPTAPDLFAGRKWTGAIHIVSAHKASGTLISFCTGRSMREAFGTDEAVTCASCIKKAASLGLDAKEL